MMNRKQRRPAAAKLHFFGHRQYGSLVMVSILLIWSCPNRSDDSDSETEESKKAAKKTTKENDKKNWLDRKDFVSR